MQEVYMEKLVLKTSLQSMIIVIQLLLRLCVEWNTLICLTEAFFRNIAIVSMGKEGSSYLQGLEK